MVNPSGMIVAVNKREEQALGYAEANVVGRSLLEVVLSGYHDALRGWLSDIISGSGKCPPRRSWCAMPTDWKLRSKWI